MQKSLFDSWLREQSYSNKRVISDNKSRCKRIERDLAVDLDEEFSRDRLENVLDRLKYTAEDMRNGVPVPLGLTVSKPVQSLATLRTAVQNYRAFRQAGTIAGRTSLQNISFDEIKQDFGEWLKEDLAEGTANSYKSYLNQLRMAFEQSHGENSFNLLIKAFKNNSDDVNSQVLLCHSFILRNKAADPAHTAEWSNRFSAFNRFVDFLIDTYETEVDFERPAPTPVARPVQTRPAVVEPDGQQNLDQLAYSLSAQELQRKFYSRLTTQSRSYLTNGDNGIGLIFPVRLIRSIFHLSRDNRFKDLIHEDISYMKFLYENDGYCLFMDILRVDFDGLGKVTVVENNGTEHTLYTKAFNERGEVYLRKMQAWSADRLSIDHVTPMERVMRQHRDELPALRRITDCFNEFNFDNRLEPNADRTWKDSLLAEYPELFAPDFRNQLFSDLNLIRVEYEIMDKSDNSRRGNRA